MILYGAESEECKITGINRNILILFIYFSVLKNTESKFVKQSTFNIWEITNQ